MDIMCGWAYHTGYHMWACAQQIETKSLVHHSHNQLTLIEPTHILGMTL